MDNVILITKAQHDILKKQIRELLLRTSQMSDEKKIFYSNHYTTGTSGTIDTVDFTINNAITDINKRLQLAKKILERVHVLDKIDETKINIGTTFTAETVIDGEREEETFTLVQMRIGPEDNSYISLESIFGSTVYLKKVGDAFSYNTELGKVTGLITGIVPSIEPNEKHK